MSVVSAGRPEDRAESDRWEAAKTSPDTTPGCQRRGLHACADGWRNHDHANDRQDPLWRDPDTTPETDRG